MTILITTIFRILAFSTFALAAFLQSTCSGDTVTPANNANTNAAIANAAEPKTSTGMKLFVPSYFNSGDFTDDGKGKWNRLISTLNEGDVMIINPDSGPSVSPEEGFKKAIAAARTKNIIVLGYVYTLKMEKNVPRDAAEIKTDIDKYNDFYGIKDIFFDEFVDVPDVPKSTLPYYADLCKYVHDKGGKTTLNPGAVAKEPFANITDWIVVFESPYEVSDHPKDGYKQKTMADWKWSLQPEYHAKIVHLILGAKKEFMPSIVKKARDANAAYVYVTNYNVGDGEWDKVATYWDEEIVEVRK